MSISLVILASGRGSNLASILKAIDEKRLDAKVSLVLSNNPEAKALAIAQSHGVPARAVSHKGMPRDAHERLLLLEIANVECDYVVLAGYMRVLTPVFLQAFKHADGYYKVINIHPSLLPAFPGANAYEDAFNYGVKLAGVTVHLVDEQVDHGPILAQQSFPRLSEDTLESFKERGLTVEHQIFPDVLQTISSRGIDSLLIPRQARDREVTTI